MPVECDLGGQRHAAQRSMLSRRGASARRHLQRLRIIKARKLGQPKSPLPPDGNSLLESAIVKAWWPWPTQFPHRLLTISVFLYVSNLRAQDGANCPRKVELLRALEL